jgi:hypothetical protein
VGLDRIWVKTAIYTGSRGRKQFEYPRRVKYRHTP